MMFMTLGEHLPSGTNNSSVWNMQLLGNHEHMCSGPLTERGFASKLANPYFISLSAVSANIAGPR